MGNRYVTSHKNQSRCRANQMLKPYQTAAAMINWLKSLIDERIKHRVVQRYLQRLPKHLRMRHQDHTGTYSATQILQGLKEMKLADKYALYAIAALSDETTIKLYQQEQQLNDDIDINTYAGVAEDSDTTDVEASGD